VKTRHFTPYLSPVGFFIPGYLRRYPRRGPIHQHQDTIGNSPVIIKKVRVQPKVPILATLMALQPGELYVTTYDDILVTLEFTLCMDFSWPVPARDVLYCRTLHRLQVSYFCVIHSIPLVLCPNVPLCTLPLRAVHRRRTSGDSAPVG